MKDRRVIQSLGIDHPILQAGSPWISNPELVAAVSNAGGLGILHPTAGMKADGDIVDNLSQNMRRVKRLTTSPFGVAFYLANPLISNLIDVAIEEGMRIAVTYGGSPAIHTGTLKENEVTVLHQVSTVRQARGAEAQGVNIIVAEGFEGGGQRGLDEIPNLVLVPQVADAVSVPVIASGGIIDARGYAAAMALGAHGVQMGTRFVATHECNAHPKYKQALLAAIDTGTVIAGRYHIPTRLLRGDATLALKTSVPLAADADKASYWTDELGPAQVRAALIDGEIDGGIAYCGAGAGLVSDILSVEEVIKGLVERAASISNNLK